MSITVDKTENGFSIEFKSEKITTFIKGLTKSDIKNLYEQIKDATLRYNFDGAFLDIVAGYANDKNYSIYNIDYFIIFIKYYFSYIFA